MASGLPVGAFTASKALMSVLSDKPKLGHITTFGGNPVIAAACLATLEVLTTSDIIKRVEKKENLFRSLLQHKLISEVRGKGLMLAPIFKTDEIANHVVLEAKSKGLILFWLLYEKKAVRISPPLTISEEEIAMGCGIIIDILDSYSKTTIGE
jgi:acetylornithine aminotransferase